MPLPDPAGTWLPLTPAQQGIYFAHALDPANAAYTTAEVVEFDGVVDPERLARAISAAYDEFEGLRTRFRLGSSGPEQQVAESAAVELSPVRADGVEHAQELLDAALERALHLEAGETTRTGLITVATDSGTPVSWWWHAAHHVVLDGYGVQQLLRRVAELYDGGAALPVRSRIPLAELVAEELRAPESEQFWNARLARMHEPASLAGGVATPAPRARRRSRALDAELQGSITKEARRLGTTWPDLVTCAAATYVARMLASDTGRVGLPLMNRTLPGVGQLAAARTVCTAMNVVPVDVAAAGTVADALASTKAEQAAIREHPFERQEALARRLQRDGGRELFGLQVNIVPFGLDLRLGDAAGSVRNVTAGPVEDLTLTLRGTPGRGAGARLELDAHPDLYSEDELDLHLARFEAWLAAWARADPDATVAELGIVPEGERELVTARWNDTAVDLDFGTLGARFLTQASATPDAAALRFQGEQRTYAQLLARARTIASGLVQRGVRAGDVVGVQLERSFELYETIHAIALLGAVYLPIDPDLPPARVAMLLEDAASSIVVRDVEEFAAAGAHAPFEGDAPADLDEPAYLLFTSGSTGRPKGVLVSHRAIDNRLRWMQHRFALAPGERVLHKTPISFDVSIWELYWPLQEGACVVIAPPGVHRDPRALADLVTAERIDILHFVPSMLRALLADRPSRDAVRTSPWQVRGLVTSGEALTPDLVAGSFRHFRTAPVNLYGPTEAAVDVTEWTCTEADADDGVSVPIGRPVWNTRCFVLDAAMQPVAVGMVGELWLGGVQLALGYVGREELTRERFVETQFGRLYRTGDLAAWHADGAIAYHGRTDDQVKLRGQRIELGEIEAVLSSAPGVSGVAASVLSDQLVVWFTAESSTEHDEAAAALRTTAQESLPPAWLASHWIPVDELPLGTSGKLDRARLAQIAPPGSSGSEAMGELTVPGDLLEQRVAAIIAQVLEREQVAVDADFFALGGDSLSVLRLVSQLDAELGVEVGLADAFARPTAAGLARRIASGVSDGAGVDDFARVLTLRTGGAEQIHAPLFVLPPAGGLGWCYTSLLAHLPDGLAVHALQTPGIGAGAPEPAANLTELAERQLASICELVGDGPFHLAGWSMGGMAAHAVAALARSRGQDVRSVTLLDAYPVEQWHDLPEPTEHEALVGILRLGGLDAPDGAELTRADAIEILRRSGSALASLPDHVLEGCMTNARDSARIMRASSSLVLEGSMQLVVAGAPRAETNVDPAGWDALVTDEVEQRVLDGVTHNDLMRRPHAADAARIIAEQIEAAACRV